MKKYLIFSFVLIQSVFILSFTDNQQNTEVNGKIKIVLLKQSPGNFNDAFFFEANSKIYYLKCSPSTKFVSVSGNFPDTNYYCTKRIGNNIEFIHSESIYTIKGEVIKNCGKLLTKNCDLITVTKITEIKRGNGICVGSLGSQTNKGIEVYDGDLELSCMNNNVSINGSKTVIDYQSTAKWARGGNYLDVVFYKDFHNESQQFFIFLFKEFYQKKNDNDLHSLISTPEVKDQSYTAILGKIRNLRNISISQLIIHEPRNENFMLHIGDGKVDAICEIIQRKDPSKKITLGLIFDRGYIVVNAYDEVVSK